MSTIDDTRDAETAASRRPLPLLFLAVLTLATLLSWQRTSLQGDLGGNRIAAALKHAIAQDTKTEDAKPSVFEQELQMSSKELLQRWEPAIQQASKRFDVPAAWIRAVMRVESGGRTALAGGPITSPVGAMGLMQVMPGTYAEMRAQYGLGADAYNPHDNIFAGAAYLRWLKSKFGFPAMFAAYNGGPGKLLDHLNTGAALPGETRTYVERVATILGVAKSADIVTATIGGTGSGEIKFTGPAGAVLALSVARITAVRAAPAGEYAAGVNTVVYMGKKRQGIHEDVVIATALIRKHGGSV